MVCIHEHADWPRFRWSAEAITDRLATVRYRQGRLIGRMESLGLDQQNEALLRTLTEDVVKSSNMEGETLDAGVVRSSIARQLGIEIGALSPTDRNVEGVVERMLDATPNHAKPLNEARVFDWHASLFPAGRSGITRIAVGAWRDATAGPMQVVSGPYGRERVHFEAPQQAQQLPTEMANFLEAPDKTDAVLRAGLAIFGSSQSIHSRMAMVASPARVPTWRLHAPKAARSASTACQPKFAGSVMPIMTHWSAARRANST